MTTARFPPGLGRRLVASLWAAALMPYLSLALWVPIARALGVFGSVPVPAVAVLSTIAGPLLVASLPPLATRLPESVDHWLDSVPRKLAALWATGGLVALIAFGRIAVYLGDPDRVGYSVLPSEPFLVRHSCLSAYSHGAILSTIPTANVYDMAFVPEAAGTSQPLPPTAAHFAPFSLDPFGYPPPFLLLSRALMRISADFPAQRVLFGAASLSVVLFACALVAKTLGGSAERRIWLFTPLLLANPMVLVTLQVGNFHLAAVALCLLCWVALERRRDGMAGALLATATLSKIFPGLLLVIFLVQRRWRAVGFTCLAATAICALSVAVLGTKVWGDFFLYHLPHVQSGEALRFMAGDDREIAFNLAPFGIPFKLAALGLAGWGWGEARLFGNIYSALLPVLAVLAARGRRSPQQRLTAFLALLMFASLRSPFAAPFVVSTMILLFVVLVTEVRSRRGVAAFVAALAIVSLPTPGFDPKVEIATSLVRELALYAFLLWLVVRTGPAALPDPPVVMTAAEPS